ncbi:hypothetical protein DL89DRAFT_293798 [Linderina pennispora]|uniref:NADH dehydrogenase [ubiquinone] 1 alpha subcomplex subunit n=1 Tax=Linderina pennispora TaxID=61395 RepID=A0A1Y1W5U4_9FUNG|nr:uncharacterized protein DL89DRAFT_293798 [Linderina pennispora]ORX68564.1 hypothetical protein DL89DRAFT_293798 [Linderina pennispora]
MSLARFIKFSLKNSPRQNFEIYRKLDDAKWGTHVGTDELGNRYFMNPTERYGRERWVTDEIPKATAEEDAEYLCRPKWMAFPHYENYTGTRKAYVTYNTVKPKYESWEPAVAPRQ